MDKRYQVFVSSTYVDLQEERQKVLQTLMEMDCIPAGMELFPAADEEQWEFIKKIIDDCDYYLLIIGGRYGSIADDGLSYTEKEFDYAVSKGIKVIALIHEAADSLPRDKTETNEDNYQKLQDFKEKVSTGRLVKHWNNSSQLPGEVSLSLNKTIKMFPAVGWIRADSASSPELLSEINELRKKNEELRTKLSEACENKSPINLSDLADMESSIIVKGSYKLYLRNMNRDTQYRQWETTKTWNELFEVISPFLVKKPIESDVSESLAKHISGIHKNTEGLSSLVVDEQDLYTIRIQFLALNLVHIENRNSTVIWSLTESGMKQMIIVRAIKNK